MKFQWKILGVAGMGASAWIYARLRTRRKLVELLTASPQVATAVAGGFVQWMPEDKAKQLIRFDNTVSAQMAFTSALTEVRAAMPAEAALDLSADVQRAVEDKLVEMGMSEEQIESTKNEAAELYASLPDVPFINTSNYLPTWITGEEE